MSIILLIDFSLLVDFSFDGTFLLGLVLAGGALQHPNLLAVRDYVGGDQLPVAPDFAGKFACLQPTPHEPAVTRRDSIANNDPVATPVPAINLQQSIGPKGPC
jgi:hypothetical protein